MLAGVPALATSVGFAEQAAERGTVLILHGKTARKEAQHRDARSLAERGYLAVALDAVGHGERRYVDFEARFAAGDPARAERSFFEVVQQSAVELPIVLEAMAARGWAHPGRVGAVGISMGGFILFGAVAARCRLDGVATIGASPVWRGAGGAAGGERSPHQRLGRFFPTPLLMVTGADDPVVPPSPARELHAQLLPRYEKAPERLRYLECAGEEHLFSPPAWDLAWSEVCAWFERFLVEPAAADEEAT
jgi:alpha-beta hydrolase superfamily lysophospholipase